MNIGLNLERVKFGPDNKEIIKQVNEWIKNDKTGYVKNRLFNGGNGDFGTLVKENLGARLRFKEAYAYLCEGYVVGVAFTSTILSDYNIVSNMSITTLCACPDDPYYIIESEMIGDIKQRVSKQTTNIFADIPYVNKDLARAFAANDFKISDEKNIIHVEYLVQPQNENAK